MVTIKNSKWILTGIHTTVLSVVGIALSFGATAFASGTYNLEYEHVPNQLIVKFKNPKAESVSTRIEAMSAQTVHEFASGARVIEFLEEATPRQLLNKAKQFAMMPGVEYVEANTIMRTLDVVPNDADFGKLYGLKNTGQEGGTVGADIKAIDAWGISTGSRDVLVGVIDTGIDYTHPDIAPNYWTNPGESGVDAEGKDKTTNGVDDDGNGFVDDWRGWDFANNDNDPMDDNKHGTHCAGTIGANGNDGVGVVGVNWKVSMVGIKFLTGSGSGTLEGAVASIEYATKIGVTLTSNSWGGGGFSQTMLDAIKKAKDAGILFVAAAGNSSSNNDTSPHYPSSYDLDNVLAVAATDNNDVLASFSCYGMTSVDVAAPGAKIWSTTPGNKYESLSGTSMATPHVSGVAALIKAAHPTATYQQIRDRIINGVDVIPALAGKVVAGGRMNAYNALETDNIAPGVVQNLALTAVTRDSATFGWDTAGDDGNVGLAKSYEVRFAATPIVTAADWAAATVANAKVTFANDNTVQGVISGLPANFAGHAAVQARDNVGNRGAHSASVPFEVQKVKVVLDNRADTLDGFTAEGTWAVEDVAGIKGFSDSPGATYKENAAMSLTSQVLSLPNADAALVVESKWAFESGYDFGYVEISVDNGTTWITLDKVTGGQATVTARNYELATHLAGKTEFILRFRVTSDYSVNQDGWLIDGLKIIAAE